MIGISSILLACGASVLSIPILYKLNINENRFSARHIALLFLLIVTFEYYFLGSHSFINMDSDGNLIIAALYSLSNFEPNQFNHTLGAGQDNYIWFLGKQYIQPERWLIEFVPIWIVILFHKALVSAISFAGTYLLITGISQQTRLTAAMVSVALAISHIYLTTYSTSFGTGFAAIPLAIYLCIFRSKKASYWPGSLLAAGLLMLADPVKVFPALTCTGLCSLILIKNVNYRRIVLSFAVIVFLSILNWHEILYALTTSSSVVSRAVGVIDHTATLGFSLQSTFRFITNFQIPLIFILVSMGLMALNRLPDLIRGLLSLCAFVAMITILDISDWSIIGLGLVNRLSHQQYMVLALPTIAAILMGLLLSNTSPKDVSILHPKINMQAICIVIVVFTLTYQKSHNLMTLLVFGGQSQYHEIEALKSDVISVQGNYRSVTFYEMPNANIVAGVYGVPTFDGQANLNNQYWARYWTGVLQNKITNLVTRIGWNWAYWNGQYYDADKHVRFDLLAMANVRYAFSPLPLASPNLTEIYHPRNQGLARASFEMFDNIWAYLWNRIKVVFSSGDNYIYEVSNVLPLVYGAANIEVVADTISDAAYFDTLGRVGLERVAVIKMSDARALKGHEAVKMTVLGFKKIPNGYRIQVDAPNGGLLMVNTLYWPWWTATVDDVAAPVIPANGVQVAIPVHRNGTFVTLSYDRPKLSDQIKSWLF